MNQKIVQDFLKDGPDWRRVCKGLNLLGTCKNVDCVAKNQFVWIKKGIGTFHMHEACHTAKCPMCQQSVQDVDNCGFWDCTYSYEGKCKEVADEIFVDDLPAPRDKFLTFGKEGHMRNWLYLKITTKEIVEEKPANSSFCTIS